MGNDLQEEIIKGNVFIFPVDMVQHLIHTSDWDSGFLLLYNHKVQPILISFKDYCLTAPLSHLVTAVLWLWSWENSFAVEVTIWIISQTKGKNADGSSPSWPSAASKDTSVNPIVTKVIFSSWWVSFCRHGEGTCESYSQWFCITNVHIGDSSMRTKSCWVVSLGSTSCS